jgi:hypothetical protein
VQNLVAIPETLAVTDSTIETGLTACFDALQTITVAGDEMHPVVIGTEATANFIAGQSIRFLPGFYANNGSYVHARISDTDFCTPLGTPAPAVIAAKSVDSGSAIPVIEPGGNEKSVKVYPNPTNGKITVELTNYDAMAQIDIYTISGSKVYSTSTLRSVDINLSHVEKGLYVVRVTSDERIQTRKVMKN